MNTGLRLDKVTWHLARDDAGLKTVLLVRREGKGDLLHEDLIVAQFNHEDAAERALLCLNFMVGHIDPRMMKPVWREHGDPELLDEFGYRVRGR